MNKDCGGCPFFVHEDQELGRCKLRKETRCVSDECGFYFNPPMTSRQAVKVLHVDQKWRRGGNGKMLPPFLLGDAIDTAIRELRRISHE